MSDIPEKVINVISDVIECEPEEVSLESKLILDLGADSLDIVDISFNLGKSLKITMPTKSVVVKAQELYGDNDPFIEGDRITKTCVNLLIGGPNQYGSDELAEGNSLSQVLEQTSVQHWVNLCEAILASEDKNGDALVSNYAERFIEENNLRQQSTLEMAQ